jgi:hypothetical protein
MRKGCTDGAIDMKGVCIDPSSDAGYAARLSKEVGELIAKRHFKTIDQLKKEYFRDIDITTLKQAVEFAGYSVWSGRIEHPIPEYVIDGTLWILFVLSFAVSVASFLYRQK